MPFPQIIQKEGYQLCGESAELVKEKEGYFIRSLNRKHGVDLHTSNLKEARYKGKRHYYYWNEVA